MTLLAFSALLAGALLVYFARRAAIRETKRSQRVRGYLSHEAVIRRRRA